MGAVDYHLGPAGTFGEGRRRRTVEHPALSRNSQKQREQCLVRQSTHGAQPGNPGAAQERERGRERELNVEGKELNNLGQVTSPLSLSFLLCNMVALIRP